MATHDDKVAVGSRDRIEDLLNRFAFGELDVRNDAGRFDFSLGGAQQRLALFDLQAEPRRYRRPGWVEFGNGRGGRVHGVKEREAGALGASDLNRKLERLIGARRVVQRNENLREHGSSVTAAREEDAKSPSRAVPRKHVP